MSRIGRLPIAVPSGVDVAVDGSVITVKGPKGTLTKVFPSVKTLVKVPLGPTTKVLRMVPSTFLPYIVFSPKAP